MKASRTVAPLHRHNLRTSFPFGSFILETTKENRKFVLISIASDKFGVLRSVNPGAVTDVADASIQSEGVGREDENL